MCWSEGQCAVAEKRDKQVTTNFVNKRGCEQELKGAKSLLKCWLRTIRRSHHIINTLKARLART